MCYVLPCENEVHVSIQSAIKHTSFSPRVVTLINTLVPADRSSINKHEFHIGPSGIMLVRPGIIAGGPAVMLFSNKIGLE